MMFPTIVEYIAIHMKSIFVEPHYPPAKVAMLLVTNEGILYALHTPTSPHQASFNETLLLLFYENI